MDLQIYHVRAETPLITGGLPFWNSQMRRSAFTMLCMQAFGKAGSAALGAEAEKLKAGKKKGQAPQLELKAGAARGIFAGPAGHHTRSVLASLYLRAGCLTCLPAACNLVSCALDLHLKQIDGWWHLP